MQRNIANTVNVMKKADFKGLPPARVVHAQDDGDYRKDGGGRSEVGVLTRARAKTKKPSMYRVLLLNDDFTPMDFVVHVLERFFSKNKQEATEIMLHVHRRGVGVCGTFTYEVAETKVNLVMDYARKNEHPLQCTMEKE
jgi:ATP-dependent Clp protease adaptor protein ClpS